MTYIDPSLQDSEYYSHGLNDICMGIPDTPLKWLGTFLHELGHTTQYQEKPNSLVAVRKFQKTIDAMRGDKEAFDPSIHLRHLPGKEEFVVSLTKMLVVLEERGSISKDEVIEIRGVALSVFLDMNYLCED